MFVTYFSIGNLNEHSWIFNNKGIFEWDVIIIICSQLYDFMLISNKILTI